MADPEPTLYRVFSRTAECSGATFCEASRSRAETVAAAYNLTAAQGARDWHVLEYRLTLDAGHEAGGYRDE